MRSRTSGALPVFVLLAACGAPNPARQAIDEKKAASAAPAAEATPPAVTIPAPPAAPAATDAAAGGAVWTCPMHPEVVQDNPGTCPSCAMALVKKGS